MTWNNSVRPIDTFLWTRRPNVEPLLMLMSAGVDIWLTDWWKNVRRCSFIEIPFILKIWAITSTIVSSRLHSIIIVSAPMPQLFSMFNVRFPSSLSRMSSTLERWPMSSYLNVSLFSSFVFSKISNCFAGEIWNFSRILFFSCETVSCPLHTQFDVDDARSVDDNGNQICKIIITWHSLTYWIFWNLQQSANI